MSLPKSAGDRPAFAQRGVRRSVEPHTHATPLAGIGPRVAHKERAISAYRSRCPRSARVWAARRFASMTKGSSDAQMANGGTGGTPQHPREPVDRAQPGVGEGDSAEEC